MFKRIAIPARATFSLVLAFWLAICSLPETSLASTQPVKSASELDYPPFSIVLEDGSASGFSVELMRAALESMGREVTFDVGSWETIKIDLAEGRLEALPLVGRTPEREELFDFTIPYISLYGAVFVRNELDDIKKFDDLKGRRVGVMAGDNAEELLLRKNITDNLISTRTFEEAFNKLARGELDAVVSQRLVGLNLINKLKLDNLKTAVAPLQEFRQDFSFAVTKGNAKLLATLNEGLSIIVANGTNEALRQKWLGVLEQENLQKVRFLKIAIVILSALIVIFLGMYFYHQYKSTQKLKKSEEKFRQLAETVQEVFWMDDIDGKKLLYVSPAFEKIWGIPCEDLYANIQLWQDSIHPEDRERIKAEYPYDDRTRIVAGEYKSEFRIVRPDGSVRWILDRAAPVFNEKGEPVRIAGIATDITELKLAEDKLRQQVLINKTITDNASSCLFMTDEMGHPTFMNPAAEQATGYTLDEIKGMPLHETIHNRCPDGRSYPMSKCPITNAQEELNKIFDQEDIFARKDGSLFPVVCYVKPLTRDNKVIGSVLEFRDVTEQKKAEAELKIAQEQLLTSQKLASLGELAAGVSHGVLNPLNIISVCSQLLARKRKDDKEIQQYCNKLSNEVERIKKITGGLLEFSKKGETKLERGTLRVHIEKVVDLLEEEFNLDNVYFETNWCGGLIELDYDADKMRQVFLNLFQNSKYAMPEGGTITISCKPVKRNGADFHQFIFSDTGVGMSDETKSRAFDPFFTTKPVDEGTGMGLSVIHGIIEEHGGDIFVESEEGKGATFYIDLPVA